MKSTITLPDPAHTAAVHEILLKESILFLKSNPQP